MEYNLISNVESCHIQIPSLLYYSHFSSITIALLFGIFVFLKSSRTLLGRILLLISISFSIWAILNLVVWITVNSIVYSFFWSFFEIFSILFYFLVLYFAYVFIEEQDVSLKIKLLFLVLFFPIITISSTKYYLFGFNATTCDAIMNNYFLYYVYFLKGFTFLLVLALLFLKYLKYRENRIKKNKIIIVGMGLVFLLLSFLVTQYFGDLVSANLYNMEFYGVFAVNVFIAFLSYLILKYQAFDIKVIAGQFLTVAVWLTVFSQLFFVQNTFNLIISIIMLVLATVFGYILFKSVKEEVVAGEKLNEASNKLLKINKKLEELDRAKSEFISIASHQLRTPLTSIKGFSSLILENTFGKIPIKQKDAVEKVFVNNEKLVLLVEDMLNVSRLESGRLQYDFEETEIIPLISEVISNLKLYAKNKKIYLKLIKTKEKLPLVLADQRKTSEIIANLIDNAIKYTQEGGIEVSAENFDRSQRIGKFEGTETLNKSWIRIKVKDTGIGMKEKDLTSIFEKFKKGPSEEDSENETLVSGTGLGVYISRQMTHAMGGHLYAQSKGPSKGTTFILELPGITKNGNG